MDLVFSEFLILRGLEGTLVVGELGCFVEAVVGEGVCLGDGVEVEKLEDLAEEELDCFEGPRRVAAKVLLWRMGP